MGENAEHRRGLRLLGEGELSEAIRALLNALDEDPELVEAYFDLMKAYETAYEVLPDPELLHQVKNVLQGVRDGDLTEDQIRRADEVGRRIDEKMEAAGHPAPAPGRTPPSS